MNCFVSGRTPFQTGEWLAIIISLPTIRECEARTTGCFPVASPVTPIRSPPNYPIKAFHLVKTFQFGREPYLL